MYNHIASNPPLGQPTVVRTAETTSAQTSQELYVQFDVELTLAGGTGTEHHDDMWHVDVWHDHFSQDRSAEWTALPLKQEPIERAERVVFQTGEEQTQTLWFTGRLHHRPRSGRCQTQFTIRFCHCNEHKEHHWKWATKIYDLENGTLHYQPPFQLFLASDLDDYLPLPHTHQLEVLRRRSETPYTLLWLLTAHETPPAKDKHSGWGRWHLGRPHSIQRWFAPTRIATPWLGPRQGQLELADGESILYSFLRDDGLHVVVLAVSGIQADGTVQTSLCRSSDRQHLVMVARNDEEDGRRARVVVSVGHTFDAALAASMYEARKLVMSFSPPEMSSKVPPQSAQTYPLTTDQDQRRSFMPSSDNSNLTARESERRTTWFQEWVDGLTYCTWNSLGLNLTESEVLHALTSLKDAGVAVSNVIIDDGWQSVSKPGISNMHQSWESMEASKEKFPTGLRKLVSQIKSQHTLVRHVAVWHALLGYWAGISRHGEIAEKYRIRKVSIRKDAMIADGSMWIVDPGDASKFYEDFYTFLEQAGISAIKTDAQFALDELCRPKDRRDLTMAYSHAWQNGALRYFSARSISCMSQTPSIIFGSCLRNDLGPAIPMRNSDDFLPDSDDSHTWHIWCNAHNAVLTSFLNVIPDWDMFQTAHAWSGWHAAARCLSGGPICITDVPGKFNNDLIRSVSATSPRGETVVMRPSVAGRTAKVYLGYADDALCRITSYNGAAETGTSMTGFFNCKKWALHEAVCLNEFMGVMTGRRYVIRSYRTGKAFGVVQSTRVFSIHVQGFDWDILTSHPAKGLDVKSPVNAAVERVWVAPLGLLHHLVGSAVLLDSSIDVQPPLQNSVAHRIHVISLLKALGKFGVWFLGVQEPSIANDLIVFLNNQVIQITCVSIHAASNGAYIVTVDLEEAWSKLQKGSYASNEIAVEMFVAVK